MKSPRTTIKDTLKTRKSELTPCRSPFEKGPYFLFNMFLCKTCVFSLFSIASTQVKYECGWSWWFMSHKPLAQRRAGKNTTAAATTTRKQKIKMKKRKAKKCKSKTVGNLGGVTRGVREHSADERFPFCCLACLWGRRCGECGANMCSGVWHSKDPWRALRHLYVEHVSALGICTVNYRKHIETYRLHIRIYRVHVDRVANL